jgi:hypothetical protein
MHIRNNEKAQEYQKEWTQKHDDNSINHSYSFRVNHIF